MAEPREPESDGQVSEVERLDTDDADTPIADSDQIGGYPTSESGEPDEGAELGPDAAQFRDRDVR